MRKEQAFELSQQKIEEITSYLYVSSPIEEWQICNTVIVLGSRACKYRIKRTYDLFGGKNVKYVVCGASMSIYEDEKGFKLSESEFMRKYLIKQGVATQSIFTENKSFNTRENLRNANKLIEEYGLLGRIAIVSAGFHMRRVKMEAEELRLNHKEKLTYIPAYGPNTWRGAWSDSAEGRGIVLDEYAKTTARQGSF